MNRIESEKRVAGQMIAIYCRSHHGGKDALCGECRSLLEYAHGRLDRCPKGEGKGSCRKCEIHCYLPERREQIREVMRYVGPRMIFHHPGAALLHLLREIQ